MFISCSQLFTKLYNLLGAEAYQTLDFDGLPIELYSKEKKHQQNKIKSPPQNNKLHH